MAIAVPSVLVAFIKLQWPQQATRNKNTTTLNTIGNKNNSPS
jgi:hypothetical protein